MSGDNVAADQLQAFVRRIESVEDEINALNSDKSEIYKEAKGNGFDVKVMRKLIADRRKDASERAEFETIYELYADALGMRLYRHEGDRPSAVRAHVENIEEFDAETGEVHEPDAQTDGAGDFERDTAQSVPAQLTDGNIVADGLSRSASFPIVAGADLPTDEPGANASEGVTGGESAASNLTTFVPKPMRPHCQRPERCGGQGRQHCFSCRVAAEQAGAA